MRLKYFVESNIGIILAHKPKAAIRWVGKTGKGPNYDFIFYVNPSYFMTGWSQNLFNYIFWFILKYCLCL